jgi:hypothetical protein
MLDMQELTRLQVPKQHMEEHKASLFFIGIRATLETYACTERLVTTRIPRDSSNLYPNHIFPGLSDSAPYLHFKMSPTIQHLTVTNSSFMTVGPLFYAFYL